VNDINSDMEGTALNIDLITNNDLCISCGTCKYACPKNEISIKMNNAKGMYEPVIANTLSCLTCTDQPCLQVCPSYEEDFVSLANWTDPSQRIGPVEAIYTGFSTNRDVHIRASSGGIVRELCRYYLDTGLVDGIITLKHVEGLDYEPHLYTSTDELIENSPGSIYHNINFENAIEILQNTRGRFALIASPCQLTSIRKWQQVCPDKSLGSIEVAIGFICGWMYSRHTVDHFAKYVGVSRESLADVTYRGGDKVGNLVLKSVSGTDQAFSRRPKPYVHAHTAAYRIAFSRTYSSKRCLLCAEHLNYLADVVVGDAWLPKHRDDKLGTSIVIVRNPSVVAVLDHLVAEGRVELTASSTNEVVESQSEYFAFGAPARQMMNRLKKQGKFAPSVKLPYPEDECPKFQVWYQNHLSPELFRFITWRGFGYLWFRWRVIYFKVKMYLKLPETLARRMAMLMINKYRLFIKSRVKGTP